MNKPIRVLQNIQTISLGGVETFIMNYYRNIDRTKVQFDFIVRMYDNMPNDFEKEILTLGGKIYNVPTFKHGKLFLFEIMKIIKKNGYKIIHSHSNIYSVYSLFSAKCAKVPVRIAHCHNTSADKGVLYPFKMILKPFVRKLSTDRLACSLKAGKWLFGEKTFKIIPNAIDTKKYEFNNEVRLLKRKEIGLSDDFTIINIGRFTEQKNQLFLLDIFNEIVKNDSNAKLILVGDGDLKEKIIEKINSLKLNENVLLLGTRKDIAELLIASDIFLLPSLFEGLPFTLIEAQATGIKCVVSDMVPIDAKILDNYEIVSLESTPSNFAKFIIKDEFYDRNFAAEIVKQKGYDIIEAAKNLENYYLSLYKRSNFNENR